MATSHGTASGVSARGSARRRQLVAATLGGGVESVDWAVYAVLAPYFAVAIFPGSDPVTALLGAYAGFAVGFFARPVGGLLLGRIADTRGRRFGLVLTVALTAAGSLMIAVVPTYEQIGPAAAVIVLLARIVQGLAYGAEAPSAAAYVAETAPRERRFFYSAISYSGIVLGGMFTFALLAVLLAVFDAEGMTTVGWRVAFLVAAVLGLVTVWIRRYAGESEEFLEKVVARPDQARLRTLVRGNLRPMAVQFLITAGGTIGFYFGTIYLPVYAEGVGAASKESAAVIIEGALVGLLVLMLVSGRLADRFGAFRMLRFGFLLLAVGTPALMLALAAGTLPLLPVAVLYLALLAPIFAVAPVLGARLFAPPVRAAFGGVSFALALSLFGGPFPFLAQALAKAGWLEAVSWLVAGAAVISLGGSLLVRRATRVEIERG
jgi:MHS family alpha-ketoglutarate permease-like MFS transporter